MGISKIIGREAEKEVLKKALLSAEPEFIAIYGRRRVGKTHLVREFFDKKICFETTGIHDVVLKDQLENFSRSLGKATGLEIRIQKPTSWLEAFDQLETFLESPPMQKKTGKKIVFLDELPWLNTPRSGFLSAIEHFWNTYGSRKSNLILIVCGSAASWMIKNIVRSKGGLHNRITRQIRLIPFTLSETEKFLESRKVKLTRYQIIEIYMVMGGVPFYLMQVEPGLSVAQIIDNVCFTNQGLLRHEYENLYRSLFAASDQHMKIVALLAGKRKGLSRNEILQSLGMISGGTASNLLDELEISGFIEACVPYGKKTKDALFRLTDEYTLFYFKWLKELGKRSLGKGSWLLKQNDPGRRAWAGFAFENICLKHTGQIKHALGIAMVDSSEFPWQYKPSADSDLPGAQIDLLIDRRDMVINLCELKFSESEFIINKRYAKDLRRKMEVFKEISRTRKSVFLTFVTTFGVVNNAHSRELVVQSLTIEDLF